MRMSDYCLRLPVVCMLACAVAGCNKSDDDDQMLPEPDVVTTLDITVTEELRKEGVARELIKRIQNYRKTAGFEVTDRIQIVFEPNENTNTVVEQYKDYIAGQVLATSITIGAVGEGAVELDMDDYIIKASITK